MNLNHSDNWYINIYRKSKMGGNEKKRKIYKIRKINNANK